MDNSKFPFDEKKLDAGAGPAESEAGSVTGMFSTPAREEKSATSTDDPLAELLKPKTTPPATPIPTKPVVAVAGKPVVVGGGKNQPGEVTRMLLRESQTPLAGAPAFVPPPALVSTTPSQEPSPGEFTRIFTQLPIPKPLPAAPPIQAQQQTPSPGAPASRPGEFTQVLQKMLATEKGVPASVGVEQANSPAAGLGAWPAVLPTEPFERETSKSDAPGSFTQLFQAVSPGRAAEKLPPPAPVEAVAPPQAPGAFTQMFQAISTNTELPRPAPVESPKPAAVSQGGLTHLFESLSSDGSPLQATPALRETPFPLPSARPASQPLQVGYGEFTRLMRTPSDPPPAAPSAPVAAPAPVFAPPMVQPLPQQGAGEFTRIISGSALREAGVNSGAAFPPLAPSPGNAAVSLAMQQLPHLKPPAVPHPPATPAGFGLPQAFAPPPAPPAAPAPHSKLQQYLPLMIVINIALLLIVVVILI